MRDGIGPDAAGDSPWQPLDATVTPTGLVDLWVVDVLTGQGQRKPDCQWLKRGTAGWFDRHGRQVEIANLIGATHWMRAPAGPGGSAA